jgi:hypothetical protein
MKQAPRQPINEFLSGMQSIWDQLEQSTHIVKDSVDATILSTKRDQFHFIQFLMALTSEFEPVRAGFASAGSSSYSRICYELAFLS